MGVCIDIYAYVGIFKHARIYNCNPAFGMFVWIWGCVKYGVKCLSPCILSEYEEVVKKFSYAFAVTCSS